jgi:hypothetical protein
MWNKSLCVLLLGLSGSVWGGPNDAVVSHVWVGESIPGQNSATLELNITTVTPAKLISVSTEAADRVEIHRVFQNRGKMNAQVVDSLPLPAHRTTAFGSHKLFLMLVGLKRELNIDDQIAVSLEIEYANQRKQTISVEATVKKMALSYKHLGSAEIHDHR